MRTHVCSMEFFLKFTFDAQWLRNLSEKLAVVKLAKNGFQKGFQQLLIVLFSQISMSVFATSITCFGFSAVNPEKSQESWEPIRFFERSRLGIEQIINVFKGYPEKIGAGTDDGDSRTKPGNSRRRTGNLMQEFHGSGYFFGKMIETSKQVKKWKRLSLGAYFLSTPKLAFYFPTQSLPMSVSAVW